VRQIGLLSWYEVKICSTVENACVYHLRLLL